MRKGNVFFMSFLFMIILTVVGSSYAYLKVERGSNNSNRLTLSNLDVVLLTDINHLTLDNVVPVTDEIGLTNQKLTFQIKNNSNQIANYRVSLIDGNIVSTMANKDIRYQLKRTDSNGTSETLQIRNLEIDGLLDHGTIAVQEIYTFELVMWVDFNANPNNLKFAKNILVEGIQVTSLDNSGANYPELLDNMIPVYYEPISDTEGVWKIADKKNLNTNHQWFDYDNYMWANAITVKEYGTITRDEYLTADAGTAVSLEDITSMWVWIPRFKYTIFNNNNNDNIEEKLIDIKFEHGIDKTGTVTCINNIQTASNSLTSETCTDTVNGNIINNRSTYTHSAFTLEDKELTGFWFAKFEMSLDENNNVLILPNANSAINQSLATLFNDVRGMELNNNIHGFKQSIIANLNSDGTIANDNNKIDIHLEKNMEWGAVSYLSQSKYGKYGNNLYTGVNKRIYKNNYSYKTGYSGYTEAASNSTTNTAMYNNLTNLGNGQGYRGAGASTTGTVYGVYDMNGGAYEFTMGNQVNTSNVYFSANSGLISLSSKYYDNYSYNTNISNITRSKLGDGIKETIGWGSYPTRNMPALTSPWFIRGGSANNNTFTGIYYVTNSDGSNNASVTSRPALAIFREFPWLS